MKINFGHRGLTLIELMIALGISSVAILVTVSMTANVFQTLRTAEMRDEAGIDFLLLSDYFSKRAPSSGGPNVPISLSVVIENNCVQRGSFPNCEGSDRLTLVFQNGAANCRLKKITGNNYRFNDPTETACCLESRDLSQMQLIITKGAEHMQRYVKSVDLRQCRLTVSNGPLAFTDSSTAGNQNAWDDATVIPVRIETYYLDFSRSQLHSYRYTGSDESAGERSTLADRVFDFQLSAGYDFNPAEGTVTEAPNGADEWLYNNPASAERFGAGDFTNASENSMRMVGIGLIIGAPMAQRPQRATQLLDGPMRTSESMILRGGISKFGLRSLFIFQ